MRTSSMGLYMYERPRVYIESTTKRLPPSPASDSHCSSSENIYTGVARGTFPS